uniref:Uncharacterized protein n=1 Tax=Anopheles atroparvus TaxID=41427 RepID=A0AAG5CP37_ANOAO
MHQLEASFTSELQHSSCEGKVAQLGSTIPSPSPHCETPVHCETGGDIIPCKRGGFGALVLERPEFVVRYAFFFSFLLLLKYVWLNGNQAIEPRWASPYPVGKSFPF